MRLEICAFSADSALVFLGLLKKHCIMGNKDSSLSDSFFLRHLKGIVYCRKIYDLVYETPARGAGIFHSKITGVGFVNNDFLHILYDFMCINY